MISAYEGWLGNGMELASLRLLGFFDRPADLASIVALRDPPPIAGLTESLRHFKPREWNQAVAKLRRIKLLAKASPDEPGTPDAHPLLREHFKQQLKRDQSDARREGNSRLYEHLRNTTKEFPDTIEEMSPLFAAVSHGCAAGKYEEAFRQVYQHRIQRGALHFNWNHLGAYGADLATLSSFFEILWVPPTDLSKKARGTLLNEVGVDLMGVGRFPEAVQPIKAALKIHEANLDSPNIAVVCVNLSQMYSTVGELEQSLVAAKQAVAAAAKQSDSEVKMGSLATLAKVLHEKGRLAESTLAFQQVETMMKELKPAYAVLPATQGWRYCELLLTRGLFEEVKERSNKMLEIAKALQVPFLIAVAYLSLGVALLREGEATGAKDSSGAARSLQLAMEGLREAGPIFVTSTLLARAELYRFDGNYGLAERALTDMVRISIRCGMHLDIADYHLESARLRLAQGNQDKAREHLRAAKEMIERMGYHRRDKEVNELEQQLG